jgi:ABC-type dipeptide/oligopeptide/nickel transport system permease component
MALYQYIARRILLAVPVLIFVSIFVFSVVHLAPGDPVRMMVNPKMGQEVIQAVREKLGLDRPLHIQYLLFMKRILMGDLGRSLYTRQEISSMILQRLPNTITLMMVGLLLAYLGAIPLGILAATHRGSALDYMSMSIALVGIAMPQFWLGLLLILAFSISLGWFPVAGYGDLKHLVLPAITLAASVMALVARVMRSSMLEFLSKDFITTARAKGLLEPIIVYKHALRNALNPVIALFGLDFGWMLGGAVMVEYIFNRPGLGRLMVESIYMRDYPVVQVLILILATSVILGNITGDILLSIVNPKIRYK